MALDSNAIIGSVVDHALALGVFSQVNGFEPKSAPTSGATGAVWLQHVGPVPARSGLAASSALIIVSFRVHLSMMSEPQAATDPAILTAVDALIAAYTGDLDLAGNVAEIDALGAYGTSMEADAGYLSIDNKLFRVMTLTIPLVVNDAWAQVS